MAESEGQIFDITPGNDSLCISEKTKGHSQNLKGEKMATVHESECTHSVNLEQNNDFKTCANEPPPEEHIITNAVNCQQDKTKEIERSKDDSQYIAESQKPLSVDPAEIGPDTLEIEAKDINDLDLNNTEDMFDDDKTTNISYTFSMCLADSSKDYGRDNKEIKYMPEQNCVDHNAGNNYCSNTCVFDFKHNLPCMVSGIECNKEGSCQEENKIVSITDAGNSQCDLEDGLHEETESYHSALSGTNLTDVLIANNFECNRNEILDETLLTVDKESNRERMFSCEQNDELKMTTIINQKEDKEIQTLNQDEKNIKVKVDTGIQCDNEFLNQIIDEIQPLCSRCRNVSKADKETQCKLCHNFEAVELSEEHICFSNTFHIDKDIQGLDCNESSEPVAVKSDSNIYCDLRNTRSTQSLSRNESYFLFAEHESNKTSSSKYKRRRLRRFEKGDGSEKNGHCYQVAYDSAANIYYGEDNCCGCNHKSYSESVDSGEIGDVEDEKGTEKQYKTYNYLLNNCTPQFHNSLINITRSVVASLGDLNTTNSCDPNTSDGEDNGVSGNKVTEKTFHSRFDNLSSTTGGSYLKEYLSGNNHKYNGAGYSNSTDIKTRTGMFMNSLNKRRSDMGKDGSNNRLAQLDEKTKVQASQFIGEYLYELWKNECLCDVSIKVGSQSYLAHKIVLAAFSDVFCPSEPMPTPTLMVDVPNSSANAVFEILQYLYTSEMKITDDSLEDILNAALFLGVTDVVELIKDILAHPTKENVVHYLEVADRMQMPVNINDTPQLFREYLHEIWDSEIFKHITEDEMRKLLSDQMIMVDSETDLIIALSKWAEGDIDKRVKLVPKLLKYINFVRIEPDDLAKTTDNYPHIFNNTECQAILAEVYKSFAIIETSALKGDLPQSFGMEVSRSKSVDEGWKQEDGRTGGSPTRAPPRPSHEHPPIKSHLTPDTDATRRSITNQFRRASRKMSNQSIAPQEDDPRRRNQETAANDNKKNNPERKPSATPIRENRKLETRISLNQRPTSLQSQGIENFRQDSTTAVADDIVESRRDYYTKQNQGYDTGYVKPGGGGGYLDRSSRSTAHSRYDGVSNKEMRSSLRDVAGIKDLPKSRDMPQSPTMNHELGYGREKDVRNDRDSPLDKYKKDNPADKYKSGYKDPIPGNELYKRESMRDYIKTPAVGNDNPTTMDSDCYISSHFKCPSIRISCCNNDCPPVNCSQIMNADISKNGTSSSKTRLAMRENGRASLRETTRPTRRSSTRSPIRQNTRSPPPRRSETPPAHRNETPPTGRRNIKSPTRDVTRTPQRRSMRLSMRTDQSANSDSGRQPFSRPSLLEHNFSPTIINENTRPSVTRKVLQTYKQENPEKYNNHVSTPFKCCQSMQVSHRKSREDIPVVFNNK